MTDENEKKEPDSKEENTGSGIVKSNADLVEPSGVTTQPALLEEAVSQLKKLSDLRQQELVRQEQFITEMQSTVRDQARQNRLLFNIIGAMISILILLVAYSVQSLKTEQENTAQEVSNVNSRLGTTATLIRQVSKQQAKGVRELGDGLSARLVESASQVSSKLDASVASIGSSVGSIEGSLETVSSKLDDSVANISQSVETSFGAVREERDQVKNEVERVLNAHRDHIVEKEFALEKRAEDLLAQEEQTRQERLRIIGDAIDRLSSMADTLKTDEELAAEAETVDEEAAPDDASGEAGTDDDSAPAAAEADTDPEADRAGGEEPQADTDADGKAPEKAPGGSV